MDMIVIGPQLKEMLPRSLNIKVYITYHDFGVNIEVLDTFNSTYTHYPIEIEPHSIDEKLVAEIIDTILGALPFCAEHEEPEIHMGDVAMYICRKDGIMKINECTYIGKSNKYSEIKAILEKALMNIR